MVSTVSLRPNHYELLGLSPTANHDEITQAFAREVSHFRPRPFGGLAEVSIAYETLRDPARRRAYDDSIGLSPEPKPAPVPASASAKLMERLAIDPSPAPAPKADHEPRSGRSAEPAMPPFMAAAPRQADPVERVRIEPQFSGDRSPSRARAERVHGDADASTGWNRPALAAGALIVGAALLGAWVGLEAGNDNQSEQADRTVTTRLPPATALPIAAASLPAPAPAVVEARPERRTRPVIASLPAPAPAVVEARPERRTRPVIASPATARAQVDPSGKGQPDATQLAQSLEVAPEQAVVEPPSVEATAAKLPLPNAVVARTIGRIGYACGQVASATAIEGAPGAFKVTCTSGHSYRAAPVRGRYRFKRL